MQAWEYTEKYVSHDTFPIYKGEALPSTHKVTFGKKINKKKNLSSQSKKLN